MTKEQFRQLQAQGVVYMDGATGTNLQAKGMEMGVCPETWILEHKDVMYELQKSYVDAGSQIILAPTFTANRVKLEEYGLEHKIKEINNELVQLSKRAAGQKAYVAGDMTMTGQQLYPMGTMQFEDLVMIYKEQAAYLVEAGVDLFFIETMMSLAEARACVIAIKETCDLPIMVSMTYNEDGRTLYGTDPVTALVVLENLGVDAIGMNCSTGPEEMLPLIQAMKQYASIPIIAKPNAGLPELIDEKTVYQMTPQQFAQYGERLIEVGACIVGGCCGTTPEHIKALVDKTEKMTPLPIAQKTYRAVASERQTTFFKPYGTFQVIGERINPTGKKKLQEQLRKKELDLVMEMAEEQEMQGATILDINVGMNGIDEKEMMLSVIQEVSLASNLPLCIDSSHIDVIEAALRVYPGRAFINSISLEKEKVERLIPIAKKYGAMFILLPLSDKGLPNSFEEKIEIIQTILQRAYAVGFTKYDIVVDGLVATVGANKNAGRETVETIRYCTDTLDLCTVCGLSNISFGLPKRAYVNTAFLTMAIANGLTMAIANPSQELLMNTAFATDLLMNKEESDIRYIERMNEQIQKEEGTEQTKVEKTIQMPNVYECVIKGNKAAIIKEAKEELNNGKKPEEIINEWLIPAINEVGVLFEQQRYFLPQLIASAEAMKTAIEYLEPMIERTASSEAMPTIVMATVEGDIHDIGKNLVVLMLKNYGYHVIDLGKDVSKEVILKTAIEQKADIIGLSALMTTTMMRMKEVVQYRNELGVDVKIIIGGAVITNSFAKEIGADGYSKDAADAVKLVQQLMKEQ